MIYSNERNWTLCTCSVKKLIKENKLFKTMKSEFSKKPCSFAKNKEKCSYNWKKKLCLTYNQYLYQEQKFYGKSTDFEKNKTLKEKRILLPRITVSKVHTKPFTIDQNKRRNKKKESNFFFGNMTSLMIWIINKYIVFIDDSDH